MIVAGVDAGSRTIKVVLLESKTREVLASGLADQGVAQDALATGLLESVLDEAGLGRGDITRIVATGYGRNIVRFADDTITEITCHAVGVRHRVPDVRTIIEIGGQDSKVVRLRADGRVQDFQMNDRCAAGTGRFLEVVAARLELGLDDLGEFAERSRGHAADPPARQASASPRATSASSSINCRAPSASTARTKARAPPVRTTGASVSPLS